MSEVIRKPYSWFSLFALFLLVFGLAFSSACGGDDDDDISTPTGDDDSGDDDSGDDDSGDDDSAVMINVTFNVDTNGMADGINKLAEVLEGEDVYLVGDFEGGCDFDDDPDETCWKPQADSMKMTSNGDGTFTKTMEIAAGTSIEYKFLKTTADPVDNGWGNGVKDFEWDSDKECPVWHTEDAGAKISSLATPTPAPTPAATPAPTPAPTPTATPATTPAATPAATPAETPETAKGGLWEIANRAYTVPEADATVDTYTVEAWRDYAESFGHKSCD